MSELMTPEQTDQLKEMVRWCDLNKRALRELGLTDHEIAARFLGTAIPPEVPVLHIETVKKYLAATS